MTKRKKIRTAVDPVRERAALRRKAEPKKPKVLEISDGYRMQLKAEAPKGVWYAHTDWNGDCVTVSGFAKEDGHKARVRGAELLGVAVDWVRVRWEEKAC